LGPQTIFIFADTNGKGLRYTQTAMFKSLPLTIREVKATEAVLNRVYDAAKLGLKGDNLALAAGLLPSEYRRLRELDPIAELAEQKGRADGEIAMSTVLHDAAMNGDSKAALEILKHAHGWVAKQQVQIDVAQQISITAALEQAQSRVLELVHEVTDARAPVFGGPRARLDGQALESSDSERP
jgi:hypothetical protein